MKAADGESAAFLVMGFSLLKTDAHRAAV